MKNFIKETLRSKLLNEARLRLNPEDMELLNSLVPKYVEVFRNRSLNDFKNGKHEYLGKFNYKILYSNFFNLFDNSLIDFMISVI